MSTDIDESPFFDTLRSSPGGDVLAARACAREILKGIAGESPRRRDAQLILTAICLHLHGQVGVRLNSNTFLAALERLMGQRAGAADLAQSPLQFVRYVAAEINDAEPRDLASALDLATRAVQIATSSTHLKSTGSTKTV